MKVCVIGTGYVGLVAGTCFAEMGNDVICVDNDIEKLQNLEHGKIDIYEPNLSELIKSNFSSGRLRFSNDLDDSIKKSFICFIAVGTPQKENGAADLSYVFDVAENIGKSINDYKIIVNKSTVPPGGVNQIKDIINKNTNFNFDVVSNPEFLKQGVAVDDFLRPDRIIIGSDSEKAIDTIKELYAPLVRNQNPIIVMDSVSAEMVKYASNTFLAMKISYINLISEICEKTGADINNVRLGMCADSRIGSKFLYPGVGYGGSCFPKDVNALIKIAEDNSINSEMIKSIDAVNKMQKINFINKIIDRFSDLSGLTFGLWGLAFKPKTNDMREAPSIMVVNELLKRGAKIKAYDPKAIDSAKKIFDEKIEYSNSAYEAIDGVDALILLTEWNEFRRPDFDRINKLLKNPIIFDGRNQYNEKYLEGFEYYQVGRKL